MKPTKRFFDLCLTLLGLLIIWPLLLLAALAVKFDDWGPIFFRQERVGYLGHPFKMWKFRTMVVNAERMGRSITVGRDPRITRVGHWLRKCKLDELPQLFNVLAGEMSLVGPRPEVPRYVALYTAEQRKVLDVFPGITDPASIQYRDENALLAQATDPDFTYEHEIMPAKIHLNLQYAEKGSLLKDAAIILQTLSKLWR